MYDLSSRVCGIDDLVLFFDSERERWRLHETGRRSAMKVGVWLPPPAVTLSSAAVASRVRHPST